MFSSLSLFTAPVMIYASIAGLLVGICAGVLGYFVIVRNYTFASHAISHIGIPGATGAVLLGVSPLLGLFAFCVIGAVLIAYFGRKVSSQEIATGSVLAFSVAIGMYFSGLSSTGSKILQSVLFGNILGITSTNLLIFIVLTVIVVAITLFFYRSLLLSSVAPEIARVKGVKVDLYSVIFILLLAVTTALSIQVVGSLLLFALLITPAASAIRLSAHPRIVTLLSVVFASVSVIIGMIIAVLLKLPISFAVVLISTTIWLLSFLKSE